MANLLTAKESARGVAIFNLMDTDRSGMVSIDEICLVHDSDKTAMLGILDTNKDGDVSPAEWLSYLMAKKEAKGKKKFGYFLNFLEQEVPKNIDKISSTREGRLRSVAEDSFHSVDSAENGPRRPLPPVHGEDSQDPEVLLNLLEERTKRLRGTVNDLGNVYRKEISMYEEFHDKYDQLEKEAKSPAKV